jgi:tetratricopeptide (TPR) repeat protein
MSFLNKISGGGNSEVPEHKEFKEGDVFYTERNDEYHIHQLLKIDNGTNTFHVKTFVETTAIPKLNELKNLDVKIHHSPINGSGFSKPKLIGNQSISERDLEGYFVYIKSTQNVNEIVKYAKGFYQQAHELTNQNNHEDAIQKYTSAIDLMPNFHEAIDNRAFCYMDLGNWNDAIQGFNQSLSVNPNSLLAIFSIGECYFKSEQYSEAKPYFEKAAQIDPNHPKPIEFLSAINKLLNL